MKHSQKKSPLSSGKNFIFQSIGKIFPATLTMLICLSVQAGPVNLIKNGNFQEGMAGWGRIRDANGNIEIKGEKSKEFVQISSKEGTAAINSVYITQKLTPEAIKGRTLQLQAMVKANDVVMGKHSYSLGVISLTWKGKNGRVHESAVRFKGTFDWKKINEIWDISDDCVEATLYLGMYTTTGTICFDDVSLTVIQKK